MLLPLLITIAVLPTQPTMVASLTRQHLEVTRVAFMKKGLYEEMSSVIFHERKCALNYYRCHRFHKLAFCSLQRDHNGLVFKDLHYQAPKMPLWCKRTAKNPFLVENGVMYSTRPLNILNN